MSNLRVPHRRGANLIGRIARFNIYPRFLPEACA